jgi:hypothetical protein
LLNVLVQIANEMGLKKKVTADSCLPSRIRESIGWQKIILTKILAQRDTARKCKFGICIPNREDADLVSGVENMPLSRSE